MSTHTHIHKLLYTTKYTKFHMSFVYLISFVGDFIISSQLVVVFFFLHFFSLFVVVAYLYIVIHSICATFDTLKCRLSLYACVAIRLMPPSRTSRSTPPASVHSPSLFSKRIFICFCNLDLSSFVCHKLHLLWLIVLLCFCCYFGIFIYF